MLPEAQTTSVESLAVKGAGRFCPLDYTVLPNSFRAGPEPTNYDLVYVVGGLYGNTCALEVILNAFANEPFNNKKLVFNGDFHWFDIDTYQFTEIEAGTSTGLRLRGNVETEISRLDVDADDIGCGCAYPPEVPDIDVAYSNQIIRTLKSTYNKVASIPPLSSLSPLGSLPMTARLDVGRFGIAITHGDDQSLAGWRFAHDRISATFKNGLRDSMTQDGIDIFASSHTCLPVLFRNGGHVVVNNGAAGISNFVASTSGLITRICVDRDSAALPIAYETSLNREGDTAHVQALTVQFDSEAWQKKFLSQWPVGTAANASYWRRISGGTTYSIETAMQNEH
jgi:hypothetical protein